MPRRESEMPDVSMNTPLTSQIHPRPCGGTPTQRENCSSEPGLHSRPIRWHDWRRERRLRTNSREFGYLPYPLLVARQVDRCGREVIDERAARKQVLAEQYQDHHPSRPPDIEEQAEGGQGFRHHRRRAVAQCASSTVLAPVRHAQPRFPWNAIVGHQENKPESLSAPG